MSSLLHVACISADAGKSGRFYAGALGLVLSGGQVDERTWSFAFPNQAEGPATLRFVRVPVDLRGRAGRGRIAAIGLALPRNTIAYWRRRLETWGIEIVGLAWAFQEEHLCFVDADGLSLSVVEDPLERMGGPAGVSPDLAIRRIHSLEIHPFDLDSTARVLVDLLGFETMERDGVALRLKRGLSAST